MIVSKPYNSARFADGIFQPKIANYETRISNHHPPGCILRDSVLPCAAVAGVFFVFGGRRALRADGRSSDLRSRARPQFCRQRFSPQGMVGNAVRTRILTRPGPRAARDFQAMEKDALHRGLFNAEALKGIFTSSQTGNLLSGAPLSSGG